jgi:hypothetical protein
MHPITIAIVLIWVVGVIGWIMNIIAIAGSSFDVISGMLILRVIGIFVAPLGAVLGYF